LRLATIRYIDRYPYLGFHGILVVAEEGLDAQVLFDSLEKQFDMPTSLVNFGYLAQKPGHQTQLKAMRQSCRALKGALGQ